MVASYVVAISYVLVDVVDKFSKARASALKALLPPAVNPGGADRSSHTSRGVPSASGATLEQELQSRRKTAEGAATRIGMLRALDVLAWQGIASIVVPGGVCSDCLTALQYQAAASLKQKITGGLPNLLDFFCAWAASRGLG